MDAALRAELQQLDATHRYRRRRVTAPRAAQTPTQMSVDGRPCLAFCSNDYLGLSGHEQVREAFVVAAARYGVGSGASHLVSGHGHEHHALEIELAAFLRRPRALVFSTGYMANLGIASALLGRGDCVLEDRLNHASLLDAGLASGATFARYAHVDTTALERRLSERANARRTLVWTDTVFSMDGDVAPLEELAAIATRYDAWLAVDDAHGFGVLGATGRGSLEAQAVANDAVPIYMATFGKALGTYGACVAGSDALIEMLIQRARTYIYTTAIPPAVAAATRAALRVVQEESWRREHLHALIARFRAGAAQLGLTLAPSATAIQPLLLGAEADALRVSEALLNRGILVTAIRPPTVPAGSSRLRITLSAAHSTADVDRLLVALEAIDCSSSTLACEVAAP
jgi:8-amino-7-oxononanoate synthase